MMSSAIVIPLGTCVASEGCVGATGVTSGTYLLCLLRWWAVRAKGACLFAVTSNMVGVFTHHTGLVRGDAGSV